MLSTPGAVGPLKALVATRFSGPEEGAPLGLFDAGYDASDVTDA